MKQHDTAVPTRHSQTTDQVRVLLVVEGTNDIEFLRRISRVLHVHDPSLPDLGDMEDRGELIFVPFGGSHVAAWTHRLAPLGLPEFHLCDRELPPETDHRRDAAESINVRERCRAVLTRKRSLENYLHPVAICAAGDINLTFDDFDPVAEITAKKRYQRGVDDTPWECLSRRARSRMTHRAKRWLNTKAADHMTVQLLQERDPEGEVIRSGPNGGGPHRHRRLVRQPAPEEATACPESGDRADDEEGGQQVSTQLRPDQSGQTRAHGLLESIPG